MCLELDRQNFSSFFYLNNQAPCLCISKASLTLFDACRRGPLEKVLHALFPP